MYEVAFVLMYSPGKTGQKQAEQKAAELGLYEKSDYLIYS